MATLPGEEILLEVPTGTVMRALDEQLLRILPPFLGGLCALYGFLLVVDPLIEPGFPFHWARTARLLSAGQLGVLCLLGLAYFLIKRKGMPPGRANAAAFLIVVLPMTDSLAHMLWRDDPLETLSYALLMLGAALLFMRSAWFYGFMTLAVVSWVLTAHAALNGPQLSNMAIVLAQGAVLAGVVYHLKMRTLTRLESIRWVAEERGTRLDAQNQRLLELDQLKSDFVNAVSHDLRTPLTSIKGYTEFLEDEVGGPLSIEQHGFVTQIGRGTSRLEHLVDDLLDFARIEAGTFRLRLAEDDLAVRVRENVQSLKPLFAEARINLTLRLPDGMAGAWIDEQRIWQVLGNLLINAAKFTPAGGNVQVRLLKAPGGWRCEVEDTGPGLKAEELPFLFKRFSQLHAGREKGGTGLGLSIAKAIVESHGGRIGVESEFGHGAMFWFELPARPPGAPGEAKRAVGAGSGKLF